VLLGVRFIFPFGPTRRTAHTIFKSLREKQQSRSRAKNAEPLSYLYGILTVSQYTKRLPSLHRPNSLTTWIVRRRSSVGLLCERNAGGCHGAVGCLSPR